ncbi:helicase [Marinicella pacifica]|uniref:Helicase n=1 Tax=Marinicella pacifica TaxID=1171543 RepID=A0A917CPC4_9GAMM|nr:NYN domain-containing protein [Marinicella pacifica]GGF93306.1 helicase [Marinicella pacifica]
MYKYAILIDAGFLKKKLFVRNNRVPINSDLIIDFVADIKSSMANVIDDKTFMHRIYYYDAYPADGRFKNPISNSKIDLQQTEIYKINARIISKLKITPNFAVRLGECAFRGWKVNNSALKSNDGHGNVNIVESDLSLNIQQKGVDMRIGLDVATLTLKKQVNGIVLVSGDSDFIPPMKFARKEGVQLILCSLDHKIKTEMLEHSDYSLQV